MKFRNLEYIRGRMYREEAGDEGSADGENGEATENEDKGDGSQEFDPAQLKQLMEENQRLQAKINEANKHKREAERLAKQKEREEAEAKGNYEQLFKSSEQERQTLQEQLEELRASIQSEKVGSEAARLAAALNPVSEFAADDLARHITSRLKFTEDGIKVLDKDGNLTVSTLDDLKKEFASSARYSHLIKGAQSSGGGATGGTGSGSAAGKQITRAEFDALSQPERMKFSKAGGKVVD